LLRRRKRGTVYAWIRRFRQEGLGALFIRQGRGRKPAFSPCLPGTGGSERGDPACGAPRSAHVGL
jgi:hypothetical protein